MYKISSGVSADASADGARSRDGLGGMQHDEASAAAAKPKSGDMQAAHAPVQLVTPSEPSAPAAGTAHPSRPQPAGGIGGTTQSAFATATAAGISAQAISS